jgi:hypothetical protein
LTASRGTRSTYDRLCRRVVARLRDGHHLSTEEAVGLVIRQRDRQKAERLALAFQRAGLLGLDTKVAALFDAVSAMPTVPADVALPGDAESDGANP